MISLLKDNVLIHQVSHQIKVSIQTVILWKRKLQHLVKKQDNIVLFNNVYVDETYIKIPMKERAKIKKRGLSKELKQIAVAIDDKGHALAILNGRGKASNSQKEFLQDILIKMQPSIMIKDTLVTLFLEEKNMK